MRVTFHGVRGSVPTPGPATVRYGGNTVCTEVRLADGTLLVLDAGTGIRELGNRLLHEEFSGCINLLITHPHWDHIIGLPFFAPIYRADTRMVFFPFTQRAQAASGSPAIFDGEHFPVRFADLPARMDRGRVIDGRVRVGSALVRRIQLNHPGGSDGFRIDDDDGSSLCYLTDNELTPPGAPTTPPGELARFAAGASLIVHDAQYLPSDMPAKHGWGHSLVHDVLQLGKDAEARSLALFHHDPERDDDALDQIAAEATAWAESNAPHMQTVTAREGQTLHLRG
ncbi:MAG TPA: MBL fold metallo-hydrolase [Kofleriaceae bacterium]|nr:MBL fold metallo-hydrolase [Kofleriaceae bacterium]